MTDIGTFYSCCSALQTGVGFNEAQAWFNQLMENEARCFELCIIVLSSQDSPVNSLFLAAKIASNSIKINRHWATLNEKMQCEVLKVIANALFFNEKISTGIEEVSVAAKRQISLCLAAALVCPASGSSCTTMLIGVLNQFASTSEDNAHCVLCVLEEIPSEWKRQTTSTSNHSSNTSGGGTSTFFKLAPLRSIITSTLRSAAEGYYSCIGRWTARARHPYALDVARADAKKVQLMLECLHCLQAWTVAHISSDEEYEDAEDIYPSGGLLPLKSMVRANSSVLSESIGGTENGTGSSTFNNPEAYCAAAEADVENSTFDALLSVLVLSVRVMHEHNTYYQNEQSNLGSHLLGAVGLQNSGNNSPSGSLSPSVMNRLGGGGCAADRYPRCPSAVTDIITTILNIFVELTSFPSLSDSKIGHYEGHRQVEALRICIALYHCFFVVAEVWNTLLNGLVPWRQRLENRWSSFTGGEHLTNSLASDYLPPDTATIGNVENSFRSFSGPNTPGNVHAISTWLLEDSNSALRQCPSALLMALVDLTSAFVEKHSWLLFGSSWLYAEARAQSSSTVPRYFNFTSSSLDPGASPSDAPVLGYLLTSSLLAALAAPSRTAAVGVAEVVIYLSKTLPKIVSEHLLRPAVEPVLAVVFAQVMLPIPDKVSQSEDVEAALKAIVRAQRVFVEFERASGEGTTLRSLSGDAEEIMQSTLEFRQESSMVLQTVNNSWPGGSRVWDHVSKLLYLELTRMQQCLQLLQTAISGLGAVGTPGVTTTTTGNDHQHHGGSLSPQQQQQQPPNSSLSLYAIIQSLNEHSHVTEALLFMIAGLVESIDDPIRITPTTSPSTSPTTGRMTRVDNRFPASPQRPRHQSQNHHCTISSGSNNNATGGSGGGSSGGGVTMPIKSSFRTAKDCLASKQAGSAHRQQLNWFQGLSSITGAMAQLQSLLHTLQSVWPFSEQLRPSFPAIEIRFLQLWDAAAVVVKHAISSKSTVSSTNVHSVPTQSATALATEVVTCAVHVACRSIETHPLLVAQGFHTLCTITGSLQEHLLPHAIALSEWLLGLASRTEIQELMRRDVTLTGKVFAALGRTIAVVADQQAKENCTSVVLTMLTTPLEAGRRHLIEAATRLSMLPPTNSATVGKVRRPSGTRSVTGRVGSYDVLLVDVGTLLPTETMMTLHQCHHNLFGLKGLLKGLWEHGHGDDEDEHNCCEETGGTDSPADYSAGVGVEGGHIGWKCIHDGSSNFTSEPLCRFIPQLCSGVFGVLEAMITFVTVLVTQYGPPPKPGFAPLQCLYSLSYKLLDSDATSQMLLRITEQVCNTLFKLVDANEPYKCPQNSLAECTQRAVTLLNERPMVSSVPHFMAFTTALLRRASDYEDLLPLLCRMQIMCLTRATNSVTSCSSSSLDGSGGGGGGSSSEGCNGSDIDFELLTEILRGFRQTCLSCPMILTARFEDLPGPEPLSSLDLYFECFLRLVKSRALASNGSILRIMQTSLAALRTTTPSLFGLVVFQQNAVRIFPPIVMELLGVALFGGDDRAVRPFAAFFENFLLFYRESLGEPQVTPLLEHVCSQLDAELSKRGYADACSQETACSSRYGLDVSAGILVNISGGLSFSLAHPSEAIDGSGSPQMQLGHRVHNNILLTPSEFMLVVFETLAHHAQSLLLPECLIRQSFTELCHITRSSVNAMLSSGSGESSGNASGSIGSGGSCSGTVMISNGIEGPIIGRKGKASSLYSKLVVWPAAMKARFGI